MNKIVNGIRGFGVIILMACLLPVFAVIIFVGYLAGEYDSEGKYVKE